MVSERVTITLPAEILRDIDLRERNRSKFVLEAVRHELELRRREAFRRSLRNPHAATEEFAELGVAEWASRLPIETDDLVDPNAGKRVRWTPGDGWIEVGS